MHEKKRRKLIDFCRRTNLVRATSDFVDLFKPDFEIYAELVDQLIFSSSFDDELLANGLIQSFWYLRYSFTEDKVVEILELG